MVAYLISPLVLRRLVAIVGILFAFSVIANAQFDTGTISGSVTDATGAVVADASITITNVGTALQRKLKTDSAGNFVASAVSFRKLCGFCDGRQFRREQKPTVVLNVGASIHVNLTLNVATTQEVVEVTGTNTTVATETATTGTTLDATQIGNLPINGRDVSGFLEIVSGSVGSTGFFQGSVNGMENVFTGSQYHRRRAECIARRYQRFSRYRRR